MSEEGLSETQAAIIAECAALRDLLLLKNAAYGDSVMNPIRIFSRATARTALCVRIDDKLSRLARGHEIADESFAQTTIDLIGYLILLRVYDRRDAARAARDVPSKEWIDELAAQLDGTVRAVGVPDVTIAPDEVARCPDVAIVEALGAVLEGVPGATLADIFPEHDAGTPPPTLSLFGENTLFFEARAAIERGGARGPLAHIAGEIARQTSKPSCIVARCPTYPRALGHAHASDGEGYYFTCCRDHAGTLIACTAAAHALSFMSIDHTHIEWIAGDDA